VKTLDSLSTIGLSSMCVPSASNAIGFSFLAATKFSWKIRERKSLLILEEATENRANTFRNI
jgi:hypothetical protein